MSPHSSPWPLGTAWAVPSLPTRPPAPVLRAGLTPAALVPRPAQQGSVSFCHLSATPGPSPILLFQSYFISFHKSACFIPIGKQSRGSGGRSGAPPGYICVLTVSFSGSPHRWRLLKYQSCCTALRVIWVVSIYLALETPLGGTAMSRLPTRAPLCPFLCATDTPIRGLTQLAKGQWQQLLGQETSGRFKALDGGGGKVGNGSHSIC